MDQKELNKRIRGLKLVGTMLDRRRKLSDSQIKEMLDLYINKDKNKLTNYEIASKFGVRKAQIYRYMDKEYKEKHRKESHENYYKLDKEQRSKRQKKAREKTLIYKKALLELKFKM